MFFARPVKWTAELEGSYPAGDLTRFLKKLADVVGARYVAAQSVADAITYHTDEQGNKTEDVDFLCVGDEGLLVGEVEQICSHLGSMNTIHWGHFFLYQEDEQELVSSVPYAIILGFCLAAMIAHDDSLYIYGTDEELLELVKKEHKIIDLTRGSLTDMMHPIDLQERPEKLRLEDGSDEDESMTNPEECV